MKQQHELIKSLPEYDKKLLKGLTRGSSKIMILWLISKRMVYGYELMTQLQHDSITADKLKMPSSSRIYPILHELEKNGLIEGNWSYNGKQKLKYYQITKKGNNTLSRIKNIYKNRESSLLRKFMKDMIFEDNEYME